MSNKKDLKAFVRYDGTGRVISGSLILQRNKPKVGNWVEIEAYECCNFVPTTTTTTTIASCYCYTVENPTEGTLSLAYTPCGETLPLEIGIRPGTTLNVCSAASVIAETGLIVTGGTSPCLNNGDCG